MKWEAEYTVVRKDGKREEKTETLDARSVREAAMMANAVIVRPLRSNKAVKSVTIRNLRLTEPAESAYI